MFSVNPVSVAGLFMLALGAVRFFMQRPRAAETHNGEAPVSGGAKSVRKRAVVLSVVGILTAIVWGFAGNGALSYQGGGFYPLIPMATLLLYLW
jgi:hypothetical protein